MFSGEVCVGGFAVGERIKAGGDALSKKLLEVLIGIVCPIAELKLTSEVKDA